MQMILNYFKKTWRSWLALIALVAGTACFFATNAQMYHDPIAKITSVQTDTTGQQSDPYGNRVETYKQSLETKLLNTSDRGKTIRLTNDYDESGALNVKLKTGQQVFLTHDSNMNWSVKNVRHDLLWVPFMVLVLGVMTILMGRHGRIMLLTLGLNVALFICFIFLNISIPHSNLFVVFIPFAILTTLFTLGLLMGFKSRQTWTIVLTVLLTSAVTLLISKIVFMLLHNQGVYYEHMEFVTDNPSTLFMAMTLVGVLGAVMDEATDMTATLFSMQRERPNISSKELIKAGRNIGGEIFGALNNVLFLIFIAEQFPMAVLYLRNGNSWSFTYMTNLSIGMLQTLISAIGIVLTVPIGLMCFKLMTLRSLKNKGGQL